MNLHDRYIWLHAYILRGYKLIRCLSLVDVFPIGGWLRVLTEPSCDRFGASHRRRVSTRIALFGSTRIKVFCCKNVIWFECFVWMSPGTQWLKMPWNLLTSRIDKVTFGNCPRFLGVFGESWKESESFNVKNPLPVPLLNTEVARIEHNSEPVPFGKEMSLGKVLGRDGKSSSDKAFLKDTGYQATE